MNDIDEMWTEMLESALTAARTSGRGDVADYLDLRSRNDVVRRTAVKWLFEASIMIAASHDPHLTSIVVERVEPHSFTHNNANLKGSLIEFRQGVRCLAIEAGWTRTPGDGFMRGGALAVARIRHFGMPKVNAALYLRPGEQQASWIAEDDRGVHAADEGYLRSHFAAFVGE